MGDVAGLLTIALVCGLAAGIVVAAGWSGGGGEGRGEMGGDGDGSRPPDDVRIYQRRKSTGAAGTAVLVPAEEGQEDEGGAAMTIAGESAHELRTALAEISRQQGQTAVILERLTNRIDNLDEWRKQQEVDRREMSRRRFWHVEAEGDNTRGNLAILVSIIAVVANVLPHIHWG